MRVPVSNTCTEAHNQTILSPIATEYSQTDKTGQSPEEAKVEAANAVVGEIPVQQ